MRNEKELKLKLKKSTEKLKKLRRDNLDLKKKNLHLIQGRSIDLKEIERLQESDESLRSEIMRKSQMISEITDEKFDMEQRLRSQSILTFFTAVFLVICLICYAWLQF